MTAMVGAPPSFLSSTLEGVENPAANETHLINVSYTLHFFEIR